MANILLIGSGAREHVVAEALKKNKEAKLFSFMKANNPGIASLSDKVKLGNYDDLEKIKQFAKENDVDFAFIGPEDPLNNGVVDALEVEGIESVGPKKALAKLETSKSFTRELLKKYDIEGNIKFQVFTKDNIDEINDFLNVMEILDFQDPRKQSFRETGNSKGISKFTENRRFSRELKGIVVKPDGLTGGKGVKVQGDHFETKEEAIAYCKEVLETHPSVVVEEKLDGEEFSLQCLTDGKTVIATPPVQDHKRAFEDDKGPNTGGMGSYSYENHLLPFLEKKHVEKALEITKKVAAALHEEFGEYYKGVMYGGFILTKDGVKLIEYNARFGDPEAMNVLPLFKTDFASLCHAIITQELGRMKIEFEKKATVCKYAVPEGYPTKPVKNEKVEVPETEAKTYYASVDKKEDGLYMTGSRAIAFVGIGNNVEEAEKIAEEAVSNVKGKVFHRKDIGTKELIQKRIEHINKINN